MSDFNQLTEEDRAIWGDIQVRAWERGYRQNISGILQHYWASDRADFEWTAITLGECGGIAETVRDWEEHILTMELEDAAWDFINDDLQDMIANGEME